MQTVEDGTGRRYVLVKQSQDTSLVADPETGEHRYKANEDLTPVGVKEDTIPVTTLLETLASHGSLPVREVLKRTTLCESDLHGTAQALRASGLISERTVNGHRGYALTEAGMDAVETNDQS